MFQSKPPAAALVGVGTDIVEIRRFRQAMDKGGYRFLERLFTRSEIAYCQPRRERFACYAVRFAAKEAVLKALGTGLSGCRWVDVEVSRENGGPPMILLHGNAAKRAKEMGVTKVLISLSHSRGDAVAFAIAAGGEC